MPPGGNVKTATNVPDPVPGAMPDTSKFPSMLCTTTSVPWIVGRTFSLNWTMNRCMLTDVPLKSNDCVLTVGDVRSIEIASGDDANEKFDDAIADDAATLIVIAC